MGKKSRRARDAGGVAPYTEIAGRDASDFAISGALAKDAATLVLAGLAVIAWGGAHSDLSWSGASGAIYAASGALLGLLNPLAGLLLAIAFVPFQGGAFVGFGAEVFGTGEFLRAAPIWGAVIQTLIRIVRNRRDHDAPPWILLAAAMISMLLAPLTRLTSEAYPEYRLGPTAIFVDMLALIGSQSVMWGAWILGAYLPRAHLDTAKRAIAVSLPIALLVALASYGGVQGFEQIAFEAIKFDRLAGLGYPTPTAMGIAIALPLAAVVAWRLSAPLGASIVALGMITMLLTGSRGPLFASVASALIATLFYRRFSKRLVIVGGTAGVASIIVLVLQRYRDAIKTLLSGGSVSLFEGDAYRVQSWFAALEIAIKKPLTGVGWMGLRFWNPIFATNNVVESHNIILVALAAGGLPYGISTAIGVIGSMIMMWRSRRSIEIEWIAAAIALIICGLWDMPQTRALAAMYGGLVLGLVARRQSALSEVP